MIWFGLVWFYCISIFTNPSARAGYDTRSIFKRSLTGLNSEFSFSSTSCLTKAEEPSLPYYLPVAGGRIIGFIPFSRVLVLCEMLWHINHCWLFNSKFIFIHINSSVLNKIKRSFFPSNDRIDTAICTTKTLT